MSADLGLDRPRCRTWDRHPAFDGFSFASKHSIPRHTAAGVAVKFCICNNDVALTAAACRRADAAENGSECVGKGFTTGVQPTQVELFQTTAYAYIQQIIDVAAARNCMNKAATVRAPQAEHSSK